MSDTKSQNAQILAALEEGALTALEAQERFGVMRLAARVRDLRDQGHVIHAEMVTVKNRHGDDVRVASYSLGAKEAAA